MEIVKNAKGQEYKIDGIKYKRLSNGAIYGAKEGRIVANPKGGTTAITQASSSALLARKVEKGRAIATEALNTIAGPNLRHYGNDAGYFAVIKKLADSVMESTSLRGQVEATRLLAQVAGYMGDRDQIQAPAPQDDNLADVLRALESKLVLVNVNNYHGDTVIDAEPITIDADTQDTHTTEKKPTTMDSVGGDDD